MRIILAFGRLRARARTSDRARAHAYSRSPRISENIGFPIQINRKYEKIRIILAFGRLRARVYPTAPARAHTQDHLGFPKIKDFLSLYKSIGNTYYPRLWATARALTRCMR